MSFHSGGSDSRPRMALASSVPPTLLQSLPLPLSPAIGTLGAGRGCPHPEWISASLCVTHLLLSPSYFWEEEVSPAVPLCWFQQHGGREGTRCSMPHVMGARRSGSNSWLLHQEASPAFHPAGLSPGWVLQALTSSAGPANCAFLILTLPAQLSTGVLQS